MAHSNTLKEVQNHLSEVAFEPAKPLQPRLLERIDSLAIGMHDQPEQFLELTYFGIARAVL